MRELLSQSIVITIILMIEANFNSVKLSWVYFNSQNNFFFMGFQCWSITTIFTIFKEAFDFNLILDSFQFSNYLVDTDLFWNVNYVVKRISMSFNFGLRSKQSKKVSIFSKNWVSLESKL